MTATSRIALSLITVFVAVFMLFFVFDSLEKMAQQCESESPPAFCQHLSSFGISMLVILLIVGGFIITICITSYIILSG